MEFEHNYNVTAIHPNDVLPADVKIFCLGDNEEVLEVFSCEVDKGYLFLFEPNDSDPWIGQFLVEDIEDTGSLGYEIFACPNPHQVGLLLAWYVFVGDAREPISFKKVDFFPVERIISFSENSAIFVSGAKDLACITTNGIAWQIEDLGVSDPFVLGCTETTVFGRKGDRSSRAIIEYDFEVEIATGKVIKRLPSKAAEFRLKSDFSRDIVLSGSAVFGNHSIASHVNKSPSTMAVYKPRDIAILVSLGWVLLAVLVLTGLCKPHQLLYPDALQYELIVFIFQAVGLICLRSPKGRKLGFQLLSVATLMGLFYPFTMLAWIQSKP